MTSVAAPVQFAQTTEIFETTTVYDSIDDDESQHIDDEDTEMTEYQEGNEFDDQEIYNAEVGSTIVEPPQSDAVHTHAPSTIVDEMEYLDEVDYEAQDPVSKDPGIHLVPETASYKPDTTTAHTPPAASSSEGQTHPTFFSPASRMIPIPRPATPLLSNLNTTADDEVQDDDWPICLYTPMGQEYMLFRSDGDTEALFEDNWLKSQPLETLFSSIRQTLENELASLTTSFAMDEIVLAVPDLDVSIAEDNCYTREISLQDLVNLINSLCARNRTDRAPTCKLQLSLQPRFIARFNQLVSMSSQNVDSTQKIGDDSQDVEDPETHDETHGEQEVLLNETDQVDDFHGGDGQLAAEEPTEGDHEDAQEDVYEEYEGDENAEEAEYEGDETADPQVNEQLESQLNNENPEDVAADAEIAVVQASELEGGDLAGVEEDEFYEEEEESYDPALQLTEVRVNEEDVVEEDIEEQEEVDLVEPFDENAEENQVYEEEHEEYDEVEDEEQVAEQQDQPDIIELEESLGTSGQNDEEDEDEDEDDLISYEEAVDQTEDGQDYRQQYINEDRNGNTNGHQDEGDYPLNGSTDETVAEDTTSGRNSPGSKRPLNQVSDPLVEDQAPPSKRAKS